MSYEATEGLAPSVLDYISGAARAAFYEFSLLSEEDPRRENPGSHSHLAPEAWCSGKGTLQAQRAEGWCSQKRTLQTHNMFNEAINGLAPAVFDIVRAQLDWILSRFRQRAKKRPTRETTGSGFASCSRVLVFPDGEHCTLKFQHGF